MLRISIAFGANFHNKSFFQFSFQFSNLLPACFRIDYLQLNLLHSLKTCFYNNVLNVSSCMYTTYNTTYYYLLKKYDASSLLCEQLFC